MLVIPKGQNLCPKISRPLPDGTPTHIRIRACRPAVAKPAPFPAGFGRRVGPPGASWDLKYTLSTSGVIFRDFSHMCGGFSTGWEKVDFFPKIFSPKAKNS
jgi:hypothetical protein